MYTSCRHHIYSLSLSLSLKLDLKDWKKAYHSIYLLYLIQHLPYPSLPYRILAPIEERCKTESKIKMQHEMIDKIAIDR